MKTCTKRKQVAAASRDKFNAHKHTEGAVTELSTPGVMTPFMSSAVTG